MQTYASVKCTHLQENRGGGCQFSSECSWVAECTPQPQWAQPLERQSLVQTKQVQSYSSQCRIVAHYCDTIINAFHVNFWPSHWILGLAHFVGACLPFFVRQHFMFPKCASHIPHNLETPYALRVCTNGGANTSKGYAARKGERGRGWRVGVRLISRTWTYKWDLQETNMVVNTMP